MRFLDTWNTMAAPDAATEVLPCCGSDAWASGLASRRPLHTLPELFAASDAAWWSLGEADWNQAFQSHPRIGERHAQGVATKAALAWSTVEQGAADLGEDEVRARLREGNRAYEAKFNRIFIVCATGKTARQMLAMLARRMRNTPEAELQESAEQQREITHLRLQKWLSAREGESAS